MMRPSLQADKVDLYKYRLSLSSLLLFNKKHEITRKLLKENKDRHEVLPS